MSDKNKRVFEVEIEGKKVKLAAIKPNYRTSQEANLVYSKEFRKAVENGLLVRAKIEKVMIEQNLWDETKQKKYEQILKSLLETEKKLAKGGIKLSEAKDLAIDMRKYRLSLADMLSERNSLDQHSAEAEAERAKFNYLVAVGTVYEDTGNKYYESVDDYLEKSDDPVTLAAANNMGQLIYNLDDDYEKNLPENKFLLKYGFCNQDLNLVRRSDGKLVDSKGRLIDKDGRLINEQGELIDSEGNLLTEDGSYKVEFSEFIED